MIDIPLGKALVPVEREKNKGCENCDVDTIGIFQGDCPLNCIKSKRKDGKSIVFRLMDYPFSQPGLSLRDYFAGQALAALCTHSIILNDNDVQRAAAADAYFIADAMLAEREKRNG